MDRYEDVKKYWIEKGGDSTLPDPNLRKLEISSISKFLDKNDSCIDIGCGNGFSTHAFALLTKKMIGADYSGTMIEHAKKNFSSENTSFEVVDILDMDYPENSFDKIITERCLINLASAEQQLKAIENVRKILKKGGLYIMCESFEQPFVKFNEMRKKFGLDEIKRHWHSLLLDETIVKNMPGFELVERLNFGVFYFVSRIVHPLMVFPEEPSYNAKINETAVELAMKIQSNYFDTFSTNKVFVFRKTGENYGN